MKVALIEVKPTTNEYIAKEMAGGLGKRIKLGDSYFALFLKKNLTSGFCAPPMVLASLAGVCRDLNFDSRAYHVSDADDIDKETRFAVVLSSMVDYSNEVKFIKDLKKKFPHVKVIVVGSFASAMPEIYSGIADCVVTGDPEVAVQNIFKSGLPAEKVIASHRPENLNVIPPPDWEPFIKNKYFAKRPFSKELGICIQKSRGCSMTCNYCPYAAFYGKAVHFDSGYVMKTIKYYYHNHNIRYFMFRDPNFGENRNEFYAFMEELLKSGLKMHWSCEARLDTFKKDSDLTLMAEAGLKYIITGVESSDPEILKQNRRRPIKKEDAFRKINILEKAGVIVQTNYILGFPNETEEGVYETIQYAKELNSMFSTFHIFTPQPGTQIFDQYKDKLLDIDWEDFSYSNLVWKHDTLSKDFLDKVTSDTYVKYYFRPKWIAKHAGQLLRVIF